MSIKAAALAGPEPRGLALDAAQGLAYVPCHGRAGEAAVLVQPSPVPTLESLSPLSPSAMEGGEEDDDVSGSAAEGEDGDEGDQVPAADAAAMHRYDGSGVAVVRLEDVRRVDYIDVPGGPIAAVLSPSGRRLALACEDGRLRMVDLPSRQVVATLELGGRPGAMLQRPDGRVLLVALSSDKAVEEILPGDGWN
jgi:DNA-binding beta-propeller fold protein YncE